MRERVRVVLSLGGYASAIELLRFFLTGDFRWGTIRGHVAHDPAIVAQFVEANADLLDLPARDVLADPSGGGRRPRGPPAADGAGPGSAVARTGRARDSCPLVLVHGTGDPAVPYTESLRLAAARPERTRVVLVGLLGHVEGSAPPSRTAMAIDALRLWGVLYGLLADG